MSDNAFPINNLRDLLDYFIVQLANNDARKISDHKIYLYLYDLVYNRKPGADIEKLPTPFYPYLITTYHLVFVKGDPKAAKKLFGKIAEEHTRSKARFGCDEEKMYEILDSVIGYVGRRLRKDCDKLREAVARIEIDSGSWAYFFKHLILARLGSRIEYNVRLEFNSYKNSLIAPVDCEAAQYFNVFSTERFSSIVIYLDKEFGRVENEYERTRKKKSGIFGRIR